jgi:hypothetical protein
LSLKVAIGHGNHRRIKSKTCCEKSEILSPQSAWSDPPAVPINTISEVKEMGTLRFAHAATESVSSR